MEMEWVVDLFVFGTAAVGITYLLVVECLQ